MKKFILILAAFVGLVGCDADEQATYSNDQAFIAFKSNIYDLKVPIDASNTIDLVLQASNKVSTDRTYNVVIVPTETDANPLTYSFPATFTIPANSYTGNLTVTGTDNSLVDANIKKLTLKISGFGANESFDTDKVVVNIVEFCAVDLAVFPGDFKSANWYNSNVLTTYEVVEGTAPNTLVIVDFFSDSPIDTDLTITYDPNDNNKVSFLPRALGEDYGYGPVSIRMSLNPANISRIDACTGKISLWIEYWLPVTNQTYGAAGKNEVLNKI